MNRTSFVFRKYLGLSAFAFACQYPVMSYSHQTETTVLVIDQGVDFENTSLLESQHRIELEKLGAPDVDDNNDGFVDNVSGWNQISKDSIYMPEYIVDAFRKDREQATNDLKIYSGIEKHDKASIEKYMADEELQKRLGQLLTFAHGTHVAGIVQAQAGNKANIHSVNIMSGSTLAESAKGVDLTYKSFAVGSLEASDFANLLGSSVTGSGEFKSIFDTPEIMAEIARRKAASNMEFMNSLNKYIHNLNPKVVNMSFGLSFLNVVEQLLGIWAFELKEAGLDPKTPMTDKQRKALANLARTIFSQAKSEWVKLLKENTQILFVAAAGNDGQGTDSDYGNLDMFDAIPASLAETMPNLVTVVASGNEGKLADFSSYSLKRTTLAAPGVAVLSRTPGGLDVAMSGTSMASPFVAGLAAKVFNTNSKLSPAQVKLLMSRTVDKVDSLKTKTAAGGVISEEKLMVAAQKSLTADFDSVLENLRSVVNFDTLEKVINLSPFEKDGWNHSDHSDEQYHKTPDAVKNLIRKLF